MIEKYTNKFYHVLNVLYSASLLVFDEIIQKSATIDSVREIIWNKNNKTNAYQNQPSSLNDTL